MKINDLIENFEFDFTNDGEYYLALANFDQPLFFNVASNKKINLIIKDFNDKNEINFFLQEGASCSLKLINSFKEKTVILRENLAKTANFNCFIADFAKENLKIENNSILLGEGASAYFDVASLSFDSDKKIYDISIDHIGQKTESNFTFHGVSTSTSEIIVRGVSHIEQDSIKSQASQACNVILFDKESRAKASPTLKIDCDDIKASHGCAIGSLNDNHIFYLLSRGLTLKEARRLITLGYLEPIKNHFNEEDANYIDSLIRKGMDL